MNYQIVSLDSFEAVAEADEYEVALQIADWSLKTVVMLPEQFEHLQQLIKKAPLESEAKSPV
jgi:hypothetical protein